MAVLRNRVHLTLEPLQRRDDTAVEIAAGGDLGGGFLGLVRAVAEGEERVEQVAVHLVGFERWGAARQDRQRGGLLLDARAELQQDALAEALIDLGIGGAGPGTP